MSAFADGFLPLHIEVRAEPGAAERVSKALAALKTPLRRGDLTAGGSLTPLRDAIAATEGVTDVRIEGPQSALLIPLRMVHGVTGMPATFSGILGTGPISDAIASALDAWGIHTRFTRLDDADSPIELSVRDPSGASASRKLYPASRRRYQHRPSPPSPPPRLLLLNRANQTLAQLADLTHAASDAPSLVSLRLRARGRYDTDDALLGMIHRADHLCISARSGALRQYARLVGLTPPRGWPHPDRLDPLWHELARTLAHLGDRPRLVALMPERRPEALFYTPHAPSPVVARLDTPYDPASRMARLQGACAALGLTDGADHLPDDDLDAFAQRALTLAYEGTESRPWRYPQHRM